MNELAILNIGIVIIFLLFLYSGYKEGFLWKCISLLGFFIIGWLSWILSKLISSLFTFYPKQYTPFQGTVIETIFYDKLNQILIFAIIFIILEILILCMKPLANIISRLPVISLFNRLFGMLLGAVQAILLLCLVMFILNLPITNTSKYYVENSILKYCKPITLEMGKMIEHTTIEFMELCEYGEDIKPLNQKQKDKLKNWLLDEDIEKESVDAFIEALR